jgi:hypothetical protein
VLAPHYQFTPIKYANSRRRSAFLRRKTFFWLGHFIALIIISKSWRIFNVASVLGSWLIAKKASADGLTPCSIWLTAVEALLVHDNLEPQHADESSDMTTQRLRAGDRRNA